MEIRYVPEESASNSAAKLCGFIHLDQTLRFYSFASNSAILSVRIFKNRGKYEKINTYVKVNKNQETARQSVY